MNGDGGRIRACLIWNVEERRRTRKRAAQQTFTNMDATGAPVHTFMLVNRTKPANYGRRAAHGAHPPVQVTLRNNEYVIDSVNCGRVQRWRRKRVKA